MITLQTYDFEIEHIKGKDNVVADGMSRMCPDDRTTRDKSIENTSRKREEIEEEVDSESLINFSESTDPVDLLNISKLLMVTNGLQLETHLELWALPVIQYNTMSDALIQANIASVHRGEVGHFGVNKTLSLLWEIPEVRKAISDEPILARGLRARCRRYIQTCATCQKHAYEKIRNKATPFTVSQFSIADTIMIDYIERLPEDSEGNSNIIVIVDCFTRFCSLHATKTTNSTELAGKLFFHASFFNMPCRIISDRGPAFTSKLITDILALVGTEHIKTLAASKEENAIVERLNKEVMRHLRNLVFDRQVYDHWSRMLPFVNRILNTAVHSATGVSPAELVFGPFIQLDRGILAPLMEDEVKTIQETCTYKEYVTNMWTTQSHLLKKARSNLEEKDAKHLAEKDIMNNGEITIFPIGSYVLAEKLNYFTVRAETNKLKPILKGPFQFVAISDDNSKYTVLNLVSMGLRVYHVTALRAFHSRPEDTDLTKYAVRDDNFFMVRSVKGFKPKTFNTTTSRKTLEFLIEWDIDGSETWEPWSNVRRLKEVRKWVQSPACTNKALKSLFPVNPTLEETESDEGNSREEEEQAQDTPYWPAI